ncbi:MAG: ion transporter [Anaerolineae bacterium]|nr:ion transporter [Anaerolineae bacterium]
MTPTPSDPKRDTPLSPDSPEAPRPKTSREALQDERWELVEHLDALFDKPLTALGFVWLLLLIIDFTRGLGPLLQTVSNVIWALFILDFVIEVVIAPDKRAYLRRNWLTAVSLVLPAARVLRVFRGLRALRAVRTVRTLGLLRLVTSLNRSMRSAAAFFGQRGLGYVVAITVLVLFGGAAGMLLFESPGALRDAGHEADATSGAGLDDYGEAVWWTAMIMTTLGSEYWPLTVEGRVLTWLLALYALGVFSYITANIASFFIGRMPRDGRDRAAETSGDDALRAEIAALRAEVRALTAEIRGRRTGA